MNNKEFKYLKINDRVHIIAYEIDRASARVKIMYHAGGSWNEQDQDRGKKHLLEHCIVARTKEMNYEQVKDWTRKNDIFLNAGTGPVSMNVNGQCHFSDLMPTFRALWEMAINPTFDQSDLDREKAIVLREISQRSGNPDYKLHFEIMKAIYTPDSIQNFPVLGDPEMVKMTTLEDFQRLNQQNLDQSQLLITVSGRGIDLDQIQSLVSQQISTNTPLDLDFEPTSILKDFKFLPFVHEFAHEHAEATFIIPALVDHGNREVRAIISNLFFYNHGLIYERLREEKQLIYSMSSSFGINPAILEIELQAEAKYIVEIKSNILDILNNYEQYLSEQKFEEFKQIYLKREEIQADAANFVTGFTKGNLLSYNVYDEFKDFSKRVQATTFEHVKDYLEMLKGNLDKMQILVVSKDSKINDLAL